MKSPQFQWMFPHMVGNICLSSEQVPLTCGPPVHFMWPLPRFDTNYKMQPTTQQKNLSANLFSRNFSLCYLTARTLGRQFYIMYY